MERQPPSTSRILFITLGGIVALLLLSGGVSGIIEGRSEWYREVPRIVWALMAALIVVALNSGPIRSGLIKLLGGAVLVGAAFITAIIIGFLAMLIAQTMRVEPIPFGAIGAVIGFLAVIFHNKLGLSGGSGGGGGEGGGHESAGAGDEDGDDDDE